MEWWELKTSVTLTDADREYISQMIKEGYTSGEIVHEEE